MTVLNLNFHAKYRSAATASEMEVSSIASVLSGPALQQAPSSARRNRDVAAATVRRLNEEGRVCMR